MGDGALPPLRALPRCFVEGVPDPAPERFDLPGPELDKFRKVLRLASGDQVAILPGDGRLLRCRLDGKGVEILESHRPAESVPRSLTLCLALPKPEKLEESIRMATEMGAAGFIVFPSERSVVKWDAGKLQAKLARLRTISREAAEVCGRLRLPSIQAMPSLAAVLEALPEAQAMSERESATMPMDLQPEMSLLIGPEGGWSPREAAQLAGRERTLGQLVLRVDTAVAAACAVALMR